MALPIQDEDFVRQLTSRMWARKSDGKLRLESKQDMRKRGLTSPDRAEAVLGAMMSYSSMQGFSYLKNQTDVLAPQGHLHECFVENEQEQFADMGIYAG